MGWQIVKQPSDGWAVWSTITDSFLCWNCSREELIDWWAENTANRARKTAAEWMDDIESRGVPKTQFSFDWESCVELYEANHGKPFDPDGGEEQ